MIPIACDLSKLTEHQREREKTLLAWFKAETHSASETNEGFIFTLDADPDTFSTLGEFMALERLCCPFLSFRLEVSSEPTARLHVFGEGDAKKIIAAEFLQ